MKTRVSHRMCNANLLQISLTQVRLLHLQVAKTVPSIFSSYGRFVVNVMKPLTLNGAGAELKCNVKELLKF